MGVKPPSWLAELHRQWQGARGERLAAATTPFSRDWDKLLEDAGVRSAEDKATAVREVLALRDKKHLELKTHRYRHYLIEKVRVPLASEAWLRALFDAPDAVQLQQQSLAAVAAEAMVPHARYPQLWARWCEDLRQAFAEGRTLRPLNWKQPAEVAQMLGVVRRLTEKAWLRGVSIRSVSTDTAPHSKWLEERQGPVESALTAFFGDVTSYQSLGMTGSSGLVWLAGPLVVHFEDGRMVDHSASQGIYSIDEVDLGRVAFFTTRALRLLTVENRKATFRDIAAANVDGSTLVAASSFPTAAMRLFLARLPTGLPHYHFGDTDPAGWHILLKLREVSPGVLPLHMRWRSKTQPSPLTEVDRKLLPELIASPLLQDCRGEMEIMMTRNDRGDFEQESLGVPQPHWPFFGNEAGTAAGGQTVESLS